MECCWLRFLCDLGASVFQLRPLASRLVFKTKLIQIRQPARREGEDRCVGKRQPNLASQLLCQNAPKS